MSKQCPGKYHRGIKFINDDQEYCIFCNQHMKKNRERTKELLVGIGIGLSGILTAIECALKSKSKK